MLLEDSCEGIMKKWTDQDIREYRNKLEANGVPVIFDLEHLRRLIGIEKKYFYKVFYKLEYQYREITIPKRKPGQFRILSVPSRNLKLIQRWILDNILYCIECSDIVTGFIPLKSIADNAKPHTQKKYIYKFDLKDFFPSIPRRKVYYLFRNLGYSSDLSNALATLCCFNNYLPQGAPTSPYIANILCGKLDRRINSFCQKNNFTYTRYADDLTISGDEKLVHYKSLFRKIINDSGFYFNEDKARLIRCGQRKLITGIVVNEKVTVPRSYVRSLKKELYYIDKYGLKGHLEHCDIKTSPNIYSKEIIGKINFISMVDSKLGEEIKSLFKNAFKKK